MGFYDEEKTALDYIAMADGYDGSLLIAAMSQHLPDGAKVLEIGMGPGKDLDILRSRYRVTGSDNSRYFLERYRQLNPTADLLELDAVTLKQERKFDCIYSNKVLHHLDENDLVRSLERQSTLLNAGGCTMHSFWSGNGVDEMHGLKFHYRTEDSLRAAFNEHYDIISLVSYEELEVNDSIFVLACVA